MKHGAVSSRIPPASSSAPSRAPHPTLPRLVGGLDLTSFHIAQHGDSRAVVALRQMLANAEYWISFDPTSVEPWLLKCPSPLRELGVAVALRYGESFGGSLSLEDLRRAKEDILPALPDALGHGIACGLDILGRTLDTRNRIVELEQDGWKFYTATKNLSVHALRAGGKAVITVSGAPDAQARIEVRVGDPVELSAADERGRALVPPEIENAVDATILVRDVGDASKRRVVFTVPGEYLLRVPGRAAGDRKVVAC